MSEPPPFRPEALAHHRAQGGPGRALQTVPRWLHIAFWLLALLALAGVVASAVVHVDRVAFVPAGAEGTEVRAALPAPIARKVRTGEAARFLPSSGAPVQVRVEARDGTSLVARAPRPLPTSGGTLRVRTGSRPLITDLIPGLGS